MSMSLVHLHFLVLSVALFGLGTALLVGLGYPWLRPRLAAMPPARRHTVLALLAVAPVIAGLLHTAVCVLPGLLDSSWHALDHRAGHAAAVHDHSCIVHPPHGVGPAAWLLSAALLLAFGARLVSEFVRGVRLSRLLRQLVRTAASGPGPGVLTFDSPEPMAMAVGRPRAVLLSSGLVAGADDDHLRAVIAHEHAHLRRRDGLWRAVVRLLSVANLPAARAAMLADLELASEQACDEEAAVAVDSRLTVARALLGVEGLRGDVARLSGAAPAFRGGTLAARVESLLGPAPGVGSPTTHRLLGLVALVAVVAATHPLHHAAERAVAVLLGL